jgi:hypothetical protein
MTARLSDNRPVPRRGLSREEAACTWAFRRASLTRLVQDKRMPGPRRIDARKVWDIRALDVAFDQLPFDGAPQGSSWHV